MFLSAGFCKYFTDFKFSYRFPTAEWNEIGKFTAENIKETQTFEFEKKEVYKYLKVKFLSHYGSEFYCPVTVVKVYGYTLIEDLRERVELSQTKIQNFNKLMDEAKKSRQQMNSEELPEFPDLDTSRSDGKASFPRDSITSEMAEVMETFANDINSKNVHEIGDEKSHTSSNIFADLASHGWFFFFNNLNLN